MMIIMADYFELIGNSLTGLPPAAVFIIACILFIFLCSIAFQIILRIKFGAILHDLDKNGAVGQIDVWMSDEIGFERRILSDIVNEYRRACTDQQGDVNTQAIIEDHFNRDLKWSLTAERFVKHSVSMMIVLGLLGTFLGLTNSVQSLVSLFRDNDATVILQSVESGLLSALSGMSTAFSTSLFGIAGSVIITFINVLLNVESLKERVMVSIEKYLDNDVSKTVFRGPAAEYGNLNNILKETFIDFGINIADRFDKSLVTMSEDIRNIEEINNNLRNTIAIMDVTFSKLAEVMKSSSKIIDVNHKQIGEVSGMIGDAKTEFSFNSQKILSESGKLVHEVRGAISAVTELTRGLNEAYGETAAAVHRLPGREQERERERDREKDRDRDRDREKEGEEKGRRM
jgi:methyl-accepting chemotaxis protein